LLGGKVFLYDQTDTSLWGKIVGFTKTSAVLNGPVVIVKSGRMVNPGWGLTPDTVYYAGSNGLITATPPSNDMDVPIGLALDANTLEINIYEQVLLN
jgi:hypothetical protein